jgi:uncharacterized protein YebE (UPF0316 family)
MDLLLLLSNADIYAWIILPILIFLARVCDVTLGTIRIIFVSRGIKYLAPIVGFFEILIWLLAIGQIFQDFSNIYYYIFYAGGFATGNYVGIYIEDKLSLGLVILRVITRKDATKLIDTLQSMKYGLTSVDAEGIKGKVKIIFTVIKRHDTRRVINLVKKYNPTAFYSLEDVRSVSEALLPQVTPWYKKTHIPLRGMFRKGK